MDMPKFNLKEIKTFLRRRPERLGIEIEGRGVRIVRTDRQEDGRRVVSAFTELNFDLWHATSLEQQHFRSVIREIGGGIQKVAVNMEHPTLRVRRMNLAKMPDQDLLEAIRWNFREQVEVPIDKYVVGYTPLDVLAEANKLSLMAYGVAQEAVSEYTALMKSFGLKVVALEPSATALLAAFCANGVLNDGKHHLCITFGDSISYFLVMKNDMVLFSRPLAAISHSGLIKHVMRGLNMEEKVAEVAIAEWIRLGDSLPGAPSAERSETETEAGDVRRVDTTVKIYFSRLVIEVQRSIDAFCIMYGVEGVDKVHLCGRGIFYPGLVEHLRKTVGIHTQIFNPFQNLLSSNFKPEDAAAGASVYAVAVGLAIP